MGLGGAFFGCTPSIGDDCVLSTDCSIRGDRICDVSQPQGYCTQSCRGNTCPDKAACVLFNSSIPGCGFTDRSGPTGGRTARAFCIASCTSDSDCRSNYVCADPKTAPWSALILDNDQNARVCMVAPPPGADASVDLDAGVCKAGTAPPPPIDASPPSIHGGSTDAGADAEAGSDAGDGGDGGDGGDASL